MAPIKFEDNMKDKLEKRTIQPSSDAWSKLADRLDEQESSKKSKGFWWIGIAASIALLIFSGILFFNKSDNESVLPQVVKTTTEDESTKDIQPVSKEIIEQNNSEAIVQEENKEQETEVIKTAPKQYQKQAIEGIIKTTISQDRLALEEKKNKIEEKSVPDLNKKELSFEEQKVKEVLAEIQTLNNDGSSVTDREIDSLLNLAQKELLTNKIFKEGSKTVDADALLRDVEGELEQSFRTKVFEALKNSYGSVKTAVAERNN